MKQKLALLFLSLLFSGEVWAVDEFGQIEICEHSCECADDLELRKVKALELIAERLR